jgi:hypothetical protein
LKWLKRLKVTWHRILVKLIRHKAMMVDDLPDQLLRGVLYVVGENDYLWYAAMLCPCGCGSILHMGLMEDQRPRWSVTIHDDGTPSLRPSVWRQVGCKSHFWLRQGTIAWCKQQTQKTGHAENPA